MDKSRINRIVEHLTEVRREWCETLEDSAAAVQEQNLKLAHIQALAQESENRYVSFLDSVPSRYQEIEGIVQKGVWMIARIIDRATQDSTQTISDSLNPVLPQALKRSTTEVERDHNESERLGEYYEFRDPAVVKRFLWENPFLVSLLVDAHEKIQEYFGPNTPAALKVVEAPEADDDRRLFVLIQTSAPPKEELADLDELDERWWLDTLPASRHKMSIDVEYV